MLAWNRNLMACDLLIVLQWLNFSCKYSDESVAEKFHPKLFPMAIANCPLALLLYLLPATPLQLPCFFLSLRSLCTCWDNLILSRIQRC